MDEIQKYVAIHNVDIAFVMACAMALIGAIWGFLATYRTVYKVTRRELGSPTIGFMLGCFIGSFGATLMAYIFMYASVFVWYGILLIMKISSGA